jgi:hypothetical protein
MKTYEFGPSYGIGEWIRVKDKEGWAQVLSSYWDGYVWKYKVQFEGNEIIEIPEDFILF